MGGGAVKTVKWLKVEVMAERHCWPSITALDKAAVTIVRAATRAKRRDGRLIHGDSQRLAWICMEEEEQRRTSWWSRSKEERRQRREESPTVMKWPTMVDFSSMVIH
ncbi:hypothetical protein U1Q18_037556 [Sarracenia purpurea var. burkii]